jgi:NitT/TauT family transport system substrate-binding protein
MKRKNNWQIWIVLFICILFMVSLLAACSSSNKEKSVEQQDTETSVSTTNAEEPAQEEDIPVRLVAMATGTPALMSNVWKEAGIDKKYGIDVQVIPIANGAEQWTQIRGGAGDIGVANWLDIFRQNKAGLKIHIFGFGYNYDDPIVTLATSSYHGLGDLKDIKIGLNSANSLPILLYRAAGLRAFGIDIIKGNTYVEAAPNLLPELLKKGDLDATYTFRSLVDRAMAEGDIREVCNLGDVMKAGGYDIPICLYYVSDEWVEKYGQDALARLSASLMDLNEHLCTKDTGWKKAADSVKMDTSELLAKFMEVRRPYLVSNLSEGSIPKIQAVLDDLVTLVGGDVVGIKKVDESLFNFDAINAGKSLLK